MFPFFLDFSVQECVWLYFWVNNTDLYGNDLKKDNLFKPSTHEKCWELCDKRPGCSAITVFKSLRKPHDIGCMLKNPVTPNPTPKSNMLSAFKSCYKGGT